MTPVDEKLTSAQAAAELGITTSWFHQLRSTGRGPVSYKRAGRIYVLRSDLEAYLAAERQRTRRGEGA